MASSQFSKRRADAVAQELDVGLDVGICHACLCFVTFALDDSPAALSGQVRRMTPILWAEGLEAPALAAARRACERGVRDAHVALADLEQNGGRSATARAHRAEACSRARPANADGDAPRSDEARPSVGGSSVSELIGRSRWTSARSATDLSAE
jgi:hypothetical protein